MRYALLDQAGLVHNVIEWDGEAPYEAPGGLSTMEVSAETIVGIGYMWDGETFVNTDPGELETEELQSMQQGLIQQRDALDAQIAQLQVQIEAALEAAEVDVVLDPK